ncbi:hypothetical protein TNCV_2714811 [Trichonephila clavipes]|nr:hypothetical protein TNCV_2714811 [Trichonephila clavipes]
MSSMKRTLSVSCGLFSQLSTPTPTTRRKHQVISPHINKLNFDGISFPTPLNENLGGRTGKILRPSSVALKSKNQEINRLQLVVKLPWAIFFESVDILS